MDDGMSVAKAKMDIYITIEQLSLLCEYGSSIKIVVASNGMPVIDNVANLANSKDKRQKMRWAAYKDALVRKITPIISVSHRKYQKPFAVAEIEAGISIFEKDKANERLKEIIAGKREY